MTVFASKLPLVTYESSDVYWTGGIAIIMVILAYFGGILNLKREEETSQKPKAQEKISKVQQPVKEVPEVVSEDDISLDDLSLEIEDDIEEDESEPEMEIQPEEEVIDIDDGTASGRLSALRREIETDSPRKTDTKEDLSRRMDSFLKDR